MGRNDDGRRLAHRPRRIAWPSLRLPAYAAAVNSGQAALTQDAFANRVRTKARALGAFAAPRALVVVLTLGTIAVTVWPEFTLVVVAVTIVGVLAVRAPVWAFLIALPFFGLEGSIKTRLEYTGSPLPIDGIALGAALLDLALALAVVGLLVACAGSLRLAWNRLSSFGRIGVILLGVWLAVSVLQIPQSGHLGAGLDGFRLTQAYVFVALGGAVLAIASTDREKLVSALLLGFGVVASYAALRVAIGPTDLERAFALSRPGVTVYGSVFRAVGSFSGAVGLASFVVPAGVFAFGIALLSPRNRLFAALVFGLSAVAALGTYSRAAVLGLAAGVIVVAAVGVRRVFSSARQRRVAVAVAAAVLLVGAVGTALAARVSPVTEARVTGFVDPFDDESMRLRLDTWRDSTREVARHPLGAGLGTVGRASSLTGEPTVTADNSYLKIAREQGPVVSAVFVVGLAALLAAVMVALRRAPASADAIVIAALGGFTAFLVMSVFGEFVEQPGKIVAWTLLGLAVAEAQGTVRPSHEARVHGRTRPGS